MYKFFAETTVHGLSHVEEGKPRLLQVFWIIAFIAAFAAASVLFSFQIKEFFHHPIGSEYQIKQLLEDTRLPEISVCTNFPLNRSELLNLNVSKELGMVFNSAYRMLPPSPSLLNATYLEYLNLTKRLKTSDFRMVLNAISVQCDNLITNCIFYDYNDGQFRRMSGVEVCGNHIESLGDMSRCFVFESLIQKPLNPNYGVYFVIRQARKVERFAPTGATGGDDHVLILGSFKSNELISVPNQGYTEIKIKLTKVKFLNNPPHRVCEATKGYTQGDCYNLCMNSSDSDQEHVENDGECRCLQIGFQPRNMTKPVCSPWKSAQNCNDISGSRANQCYAGCPYSCEVDRLDIQKTSLNIDNQVLAGLLGGNLSDSELAWFIEKHSIVRIVYHGGEYTEISQYFVVNFGTLMSKLGGLIGLLLGASVLTVLHTLVFVLWYAFGSDRAQINVRTDEQEKD